MSTTPCPTTGPMTEQGLPAGPFKSVTLSAVIPSAAVESGAEATPAPVTLPEIEQLIQDAERRGLFPVQCAESGSDLTITFASMQDGEPKFYSTKIPTAGDHAATCHRGVCVVLLGPDGVGKSTTKSKVMEMLRPLLPAQVNWHYRPRNIGRIGPGRPRSQPHAKAARSLPLSVLYAVTVFTDYWITYMFRARKLLAEQGLIVFDRSYDDIVVDPVRYRYGGPMGLIRLLRSWLPIPDRIFVVLDADESVILSRKAELPLPELTRQRVAYRQWASDQTNAAYVRNSGSIEATATEVCAAILEYLNLRFQRDHAKWFTGRRNLGGGR
jgi:thymidylate kinase